MWVSGLLLTAALGGSLVSRGFLNNICQFPLYFPFLVTATWAISGKITRLAFIHLKLEHTLLLSSPSEPPRLNLVQLLPKAQQKVAVFCVWAYIHLLAVLKPLYFASILRQRTGYPRLLCLSLYYAGVTGLSRVSYSWVQAIQVVVMLACTSTILRSPDHGHFSSFSSPFFLLLPLEYLLYIPSVIAWNGPKGYALEAIIIWVCSLLVAYSFLDLRLYTALSQLLPNSVLLYSAAKDLHGALRLHLACSVLVVTCLCSMEFQVAELLVCVASVPFLIVFFVLIPTTYEERTGKQGKFRAFLPLLIITSGVGHWFFSSTF